MLKRVLLIIQINNRHNSQFRESDSGFRIFIFFLTRFGFKSIYFLFSNQNKSTNKRQNVISTKQFIKNSMFSLISTKVLIIVCITFILLIIAFRKLLIKSKSIPLLRLDKTIIIMFFTHLIVLFAISMFSIIYSYCNIIYFVDFRYSHSRQPKQQKEFFFKFPEFTNSVTFTANLIKSYFSQTVF